MTSNVLFIGLGVMGYHMAGHLSKQCKLYVYNRNQTKVSAWLNEHHGTAVSSLESLPKEVNVIITCIGKDSDLEEVYLSEKGLLSQANQERLFIDHTTASAQIAQKISEQAELRGQEFIDAPVSGGEQGAINGQLTIMCGGSNSSYVRARPIMESYARAVNLMGENGAGQLTKMANQIAVAGVIQGLSEAIHFSEQAGLNSQQVIDVISKGAAQSWQMENRSTTMIEGHYEHGFAVDLMRKDLDIVLSEARQREASLPITALIDQFYSDVQKMGGGKWDTSSLLERLRTK